jgi:hypothetical protein
MTSSSWGTYGFSLESLISHYRDSRGDDDLQVRSGNGSSRATTFEPEQTEYWCNGQLSSENNSELQQIK